MFQLLDFLLLRLNDGWLLPPAVYDTVLQARRTVEKKEEVILQLVFRCISSQSDTNNLST